MFVCSGGGGGDTSSSRRLGEGGEVSRLGCAQNIRHAFVGIMSQFGIMSHSVLCRIRGYVVRYYVAFGVMSFVIMLHSALCSIRTNDVRDRVVQRNVVWRNVVRRNVVLPTVGVSVVSYSGSEMASIRIPIEETSCNAYPDHLLN